MAGFLRGSVQLWAPGGKMNQPALKTKFFDQPRGVMLIAATEFWERFSYYGFIGLVTLFMAADPRLAGWGWTRALP
jgi:dipeptide/tripeptide permease